MLAEIIKSFGLQGHVWAEGWGTGLSLFLFAVIDVTFPILANGKADQNPRDGGNRHGDQNTRKALKTAPRKNSEQDPDRVQPYAITHQFGRKDIAFQRLPDKEDKQNKTDLRHVMKLQER